MRAGIVTGLRSFELIDVPEPTPRDDQVVVEIKRCGICGSDVHAYADGWNYAPVICGHEWYGEVVALGSNAAEAGAAEGQHVMAGLAAGCGKCRYCRIGQPFYCQPAHRAYNGLDEHPSPHGGFAPYLAVDANRLAVMPDGLTLAQGALVEPASVAFHAVRKSGMAAGDSVAVVGAGPIGQFVALCARAAGAGQVIVVEPDAERRQKAVALGADVGIEAGPDTRSAVRERTEGLGVDVSFDAAGVPQTLEASIDLVRRGGTMCMVGVSSQPTPVTTNRWLNKELTLKTSMMFTRTEATAVGRMILDGRLPAAALHEATIGLDDLPATVEAMANRERNEIKILVDPTAP